MSHLRLHSLDGASDEAPAPIPFPHIANLTSKDRASDEPHQAQRLTNDIERHLDDVQRRLDDVKSQLDDAFRLPTSDDYWPPSAA